MDAIKSYESSDSDQQEENYPRRKMVSAGSTKTTKPCSANELANVRKYRVRVGSSSSPHHTESSLSLPRVKGYGAFMHLQTPEEREPPNASLYGETKRKRVNNAHHSQRKKRDAGGHPPNKYADGQGKLDVDLHRHPPPHQYRGSDSVLPMNRLDVSSYGCPAEDAGGSVVRHGNHLPQQPQHSNQMKKQSNSDIERFNVQTRQSNVPGLKPYVPKRHRKDVSKQDSTEQTQDQRSCPDIFTTDPYIAAHDVQSRASCRPPGKIFCTFASHEGPVTRVQWNIPQFSHLLLSSSLDKTVRVWDYSTLKRCVRTLCCHEGAVKDAQWSSDGRQIISGGFDKTARLTDVQSGTTFQVFEHPTYVTCLKWLPKDPQLFLSGTYGSTVYCWDTRTGGIVHQYSGKLGQILAVEFINEGAAFVSSCDTVSQDSADKTIMVWDTDTAAVLSNQLYHEKYTCPCLRAHPTENVFLAQSNANYIALFSTQSPFRINKYQRFGEHQVEGYSIGFDISPNGSLVASGSSDGKTYLYKYHSGSLIKTLEGGPDNPCTDVAWHPVMPSVLANCTWEGTVNVWR